MVFQLREGGWDAVTAHLFVAGLVELLLEVTDSVEHCWVLGHELEVWLSESFGLDVLGIDLVGSNRLLGLLGRSVVCLRGHHGLLEGLRSERHHGCTGSEIFGSGADHFVYLGDADGFVCFGEEKEDDDGEEQEDEMMTRTRWQQKGRRSVGERAASTYKGVHVHTVGRYRL